MAGIGFSLRRMFSKKGFLNLCRAYGYAGVITTGPMLLGVALLVGMSVTARLGGMSAHNRELLNCMLTYTLLASLTVTSWFNMIVTRYTSDQLYEERFERVMPGFYGTCGIMLGIDTVLYGIFLLFSGITPAQMACCLVFSQVLIVVWTEMIYLTALKDYKAIVTAFTLSLMIGFFVALVLVIIGLVTVVSLMLCVILAYGILMVWFYCLLLDYFPRGTGSNYRILGWFDKFPHLAAIGGFVNIGLFSHLVIMYFGPLRVQVQGLFYGAPQHDVPALFAFLSMLVTTINFVTSVEVNFYPRYRNYYSLFNDTGSIRDIELAEDEMLSVLRQEMTYNGYKQLAATLLFIVVGSLVLETLPLGFSDTSIGIFRLLCVGYGIYAIANSLMLILLYFEDYGGALAGTAVFAALATGITIIQVAAGSVEYYGLGFTVGAVGFYFTVWLRLEWYTRRLPYFLLCRQAVVPDEVHGLLIRLSRYLEEKERAGEERIARKLEAKGRKIREEMENAEQISQT